MYRRVITMKEPARVRRGDGGVMLDVPPMGVRFIAGVEPGLDDVERFSGISFCRAIAEASFGRELLVVPGSLSVCQWAPVALGLKRPENEFEGDVSPRMEGPVAGVYLAPVDHYREGLVPHVVIVRTGMVNFREIISALGGASFLDPDAHGRDATSLGDFTSGRASGRAVGPVNRLLSFLNRAGAWRRFTALIFKSTRVTRIYNRLITRWLVNMSMCRNSTVIPFREGKANISHFCTGGIAWGGNDPSNMTSGFPWEIYQKIAPLLRYPLTAQSHEDGEAGG